MNRDRLADAAMRECRLRLHLERERFRIEWVDTGVWGGSIRWEQGERSFVVSLPVGLDDPWRIVWVMCHEMRHAWQMCNGWLTYSGGRRWKGRAYHKDTSDSVDPTEYNKAPDEVDANDYADTIAPALWDRYVR